MSLWQTGHLHTGLHQLEIVPAQMLDSVTDRQSIGNDRLGELRLIRLGFLELMHRVDTAFRIPGMKLSD